MSSNYLELQEQHTCRICLETDSYNNLIYPCKCAGNSKFVHRSWENQISNRNSFKTTKYKRF